MKERILGAITVMSEDRCNQSLGASLRCTLAFSEAFPTNEEMKIIEAYKNGVEE